MLSQTSKTHVLRTLHVHFSVNILLPHVLGSSAMPSRPRGRHFSKGANKCKGCGSNLVRGIIVGRPPERQSGRRKTGKRCAATTTQPQLRWLFTLPVTDGVCCLKADGARQRPLGLSSLGAIRCWAATTTPPPPRWAFTNRSVVWHSSLFFFAWSDPRSSGNLENPTSKISHFEMVGGSESTTHICKFRIDITAPHPTPKMTK